MRTIEAYREEMLILPIEFCIWSPCMNDSGFCSHYEGLDSSGEAVLCSLDSTTPEA
jgi:hypothetical protein